MAAPRLRRVVEVDQPRGLVLLIHGGFEQSMRPLSREHPAVGWPHMKWFQDHMSVRLAARGIEVWGLVHRIAGWNDDEQPSPVPDAQWALAEARTRRPGVPIVLVGHSMGARTSIRVAGDPAVVGVVGLCPWFPGSESVEPLVGTPLRVAYAEWDWDCPWISMRRFVRNAAEVTDVQVTSMGRDIHYMLRGRHWMRYLVRTVTELLPGSAPDAPTVRISWPGDDPR